MIVKRAHTHFRREFERNSTVCLLRAISVWKWCSSIYGKAKLMNSAHPLLSFDQAVTGLLNGDFSRLQPLVILAGGGGSCPIMDWHQQGLFTNRADALAEALTCASFNGAVTVVEYFLSNGLDPSGGARTGLNALHWAANRGQKNVAELLIRAGAPLESINSYGGTVLGCTVWSSVHETKPAHLKIVKLLLNAGADPFNCDYPSGRADVDALIAARRAERKA